MRLNKNNLKGEIEELTKGLDILGIEYNNHILEAFRRYLETLFEYKNKIHLLSHNDYNRISRRHFLTSLMALPYLADRHNVCDIGAGAGFPSIPLKIVRPEINVTLFESKKKTAEFLHYVTNTLNLSGVRIINERAEDYQGQVFDVILLKAAGKIKKLVKVIDRLIAPKGCAIFFKSHRVEDEIKTAEEEIKKRGYQVGIEKLITPIESLPLALVMLNKSSV